MEDNDLKIGFNDIRRSDYNQEDEKNNVIAEELIEKEPILKQKEDTIKEVQPIKLSIPSLINLYTQIKEQGKTLNDINIDGLNFNESIMGISSLMKENLSDIVPYNPYQIKKEHEQINSFEKGFYKLTLIKKGIPTSYWLDTQALGLFSHNDFYNFSPYIKLYKDLLNRKIDVVTENYTYDYFSKILGPADLGIIENDIKTKDPLEIEKKVKSMLFDTIIPLCEMYEMIEKTNLLVTIDKRGFIDEANINKLTSYIGKKESKKHNGRRITNISYIDLNNINKTNDIITVDLADKQERTALFALLEVSILKKYPELEILIKPEKFDELGQIKTDKKEDSQQSFISQLIEVFKQERNEARDSNIFKTDEKIQDFIDTTYRNMSEEKKLKIQEVLSNPVSQLVNCSYFTDRLDKGEQEEDSASMYKNVDLIDPLLADPFTFNLANSYKTAITNYENDIIKTKEQDDNTEIKETPVMDRGTMLLNAIPEIFLPTTKIFTQNNFVTAQNKIFSNTTLFDILFYYINIKEKETRPDYYSRFYKLMKKIITEEELYLKNFPNVPVNTFSEISKYLKLEAKDFPGVEQEQIEININFFDSIKDDLYQILAELDFEKRYPCFDLKSTILPNPPIKAYYSSTEYFEFNTIEKSLIANILLNANPKPDLKKLDTVQEFYNISNNIYSNSVLTFIQNLPPKNVLSTILTTLIKTLEYNPILLETIQQKYKSDHFIINNNLEGTSFKYAIPILEKYLSENKMNIAQFLNEAANKAEESINDKNKNIIEEKQKTKKLLPDKDQQKVILSQNEKNVVVMAPAGSGKTSTASLYMEECIRRGCPPDKILAYTFTTTATKETKDGLHKNTLLGDDEIDKISISTMHSFCAKFLTKYAKNNSTLPQDFRIIMPAELAKKINGFIFLNEDRNKKTQEIEEKLKNGKSNALYSRIKTTKLMMEFFCTLKDRGLIVNNENPQPENYSAELINEIKNFPWAQGSSYDNQVNSFRYYLNAYDMALAKEGCIDQADLLYKTIDVLKNDSLLASRIKNSYNIICVDEVQDTNTLQKELVNIIRGEKTRLFLIGDLNQSIFGFRGSNSELVDETVKKADSFETVVLQLSTNYRSTKQIQAVLNRIMESYTGEKLDIKTKSEGLKPILQISSQDNNLEDIYSTLNQIITRNINEGKPPYDDIAILCSTNAEIKKIENYITQKDPKIAIQKKENPFHFSQFEMLSKLIEYYNHQNDSIFFANLYNKIIEIYNKKIEKKFQLPLMQNYFNNNAAISVNEAITYYNQFLNSNAHPLTGQKIPEHINAVFFQTLQTLENNKQNSLVDFLSVFNNLLAQDFSVKTQLYTESDMLALKFNIDIMENKTLENGNNYLFELSLLKEDLSASTKTESGIALKTVHSSKGEEWADVIVSNVQVFNDTKAEKNVLYVALSRAKQNLYMLYDDERKVPNVLLRNRTLLTRPVGVFSDFQNEIEQKVGPMEILEQEEEALSISILEEILKDISFPIPDMNKTPYSTPTQQNLPQQQQNSPQQQQNLPQQQQNSPQQQQNRIPHAFPIIGKIHN